MGSKTGSDAIFNFTIAFRIQRNLRAEKAAQIHQLQAGKRWHFLFGEWKQEAATFLASPWCSASRGALSLRKQCESINCRRENEGTSCLTSKTGSEVILSVTTVFSIPRNPHPEFYDRKMLTIPCIPVKLLASLSTSIRHFIGLN